MGGFALVYLVKVMPYWRGIMLCWGVLGLNIGCSSILSISTPQYWYIQRQVPIMGLPSTYMIELELFLHSDRYEQGCAVLVLSITVGAKCCCCISKMLLNLCFSLQVYNP